MGVCEVWVDGRLRLRSEELVLLVKLVEGVESVEAEMAVDRGREDSVWGRGEGEERVGARRGKGEEEVEWRQRLAGHWVGQLQDADWLQISSMCACPVSCMEGRVRIVAESR